MFSTIMFQRVLSNKTLPRLSRFVSVSRINKFCNSSSSRNDDNTVIVDNAHNEAFTKDVEYPSGEENVTRLLKDAATYSDANDTSWATSPYPAGAPTSVEEETPSKPKINPQEISTILFPGQGIIKVGSVHKYLHYPETKELFEIANEILDYDLLKLCLKGPQEKLDQTRFNQPATVITSLAALERLREDRPKVLETCVAAAGYSIGELTALIFSGALSFEEGIRLVSVRGAAMQYAAEKSPQGMLSVYCTPQARISEACTDAQKWAQDCGVPDPVCQVAVYLYTQAKILGGNMKALEYIEKNSEKYGLRKLSRLPVSGAFHTKLMEPALKAFYKLLNTLEINEPRCQVYSNYKGCVYGNEKLIRKSLPKQIVSPVKWEQIMQAMFNRPIGDNFPRAFDVGSNGRMKTILKSINAKAYNNCIVI